MSTYKRPPSQEWRDSLLSRAAQIDEQAKKEREQKAADDALNFLRSKLPDSHPLPSMERESIPTEPTLIGWMWLIGGALTFLAAGVVLGAFLARLGWLP